MINIKREITNPHTLYLTKSILYRTRIEQGLEAYEIMKRLVYVAYRMSEKRGFITYGTFLNFAMDWLDRKETIYDFMGLRHREGQYAIIFGLDLHTVLKGIYAQIEQEILNYRKHYNNIYHE